MCMSPDTPRARNQIAVTGPKTRDTPAVPKRCTTNSADDDDDRDRHDPAARGPARRSGTPSTADSTEIAGVMIASPKNSAAPRTPEAEHPDRPLREARRRQRHQRQRAALALVVGPEHEEDVLDGHETVSAQTISDSSPRTSSASGRAARSRRAAPRGRRRSGWYRYRHRRHRERRGRGAGIRFFAWPAGSVAAAPALLPGAVVCVICLRSPW